MSMPRFSSGNIQSFLDNEKNSIYKTIFRILVRIQHPQLAISDTLPDAARINRIVSTLNTLTTLTTLTDIKNELTALGIKDNNIIQSGTLPDFSLNFTDLSRLVLTENVHTALIQQNQAHTDYLGNIIKNTNQDSMEDAIFKSTNNPSFQTLQAFEDVVKELRNPNFFSNASFNNLFDSIGLDKTKTTELINITTRDKANQIEANIKALGEPLTTLPIDKNVLIQRLKDGFTESHLISIANNFINPTTTKELVLASKTLGIDTNASKSYFVNTAIEQMTSQSGKALLAKQKDILIRNIPPDMTIRHLINDVSNFENISSWNLDTFKSTARLLGIENAAADSILKTKILSDLRSSGVPIPFEVEFITSFKPTTSALTSREAFVEEFRRLNNSQEFSDIKSSLQKLGFDAITLNSFAAKIYATKIHATIAQRFERKPNLNMLSFDFATIHNAVLRGVRDSNIFERAANRIEDLEYYNRTTLDQDLKLLGANIEVSQLLGIKSDTIARDVQNEIKPTIEEAYKEDPSLGKKVFSEIVSSRVIQKKLLSGAKRNIFLNVAQELLSNDLKNFKSASEHFEINRNDVNSILIKKIMADLSLQRIATLPEQDAFLANFVPITSTLSTREDIVEQIKKLISIEEAPNLNDIKACLVSIGFNSRNLEEFATRLFALKTQAIIDDKFSNIPGLKNTVDVRAIYTNALNGMVTQDVFVKAADELIRINNDYTRVSLGAWRTNQSLQEFKEINQNADILGIPYATRNKIYANNEFSRINDILNTTVPPLSPLLFQLLENHKTEITNFIASNASNTNIGYDKGSVEILTTSNVESIEDLKNQLKEIGVRNLETDAILLPLYAEMICDRVVRGLEADNPITKIYNQNPAGFKLGFEQAVKANKKEFSYYTESLESLTDVNHNVRTIDALLNRFGCRTHNRSNAIYVSNQLSSFRDKLHENENPFLKEAIERITNEYKTLTIVPPDKLIRRTPAETQAVLGELLIASENTYYHFQQNFVSLNFVIPESDKAKLYIENQLKYLNENYDRLFPKTSETLKESIQGASKRHLINSLVIYSDKLKNTENFKSLILSVTQPDNTLTEVLNACHILGLASHNELTSISPAELDAVKKIYAENQTEVLDEVIEEFRAITPFADYRKDEVTNTILNNLDTFKPDFVQSLKLQLKSEDKEVISNAFKTLGIEVTKNQIEKLAKANRKQPVIAEIEKYSKTLSNALSISTYELPEKINLQRTLRNLKGDFTEVKSAVKTLNAVPEAELERVSKRVYSEYQFSRILKSLEHNAPATQILNRTENKTTLLEDLKNKDKTQIDNYIIQLKAISADSIALIFPNLRRGQTKKIAAVNLYNEILDATKHPDLIDTNSALYEYLKINKTEVLARLEECVEEDSPRAVISHAKAYINELKRQPRIIGPRDERLPPEERIKDQAKRALGLENAKIYEHVKSKLSSWIAATKILKKELDEGPYKNYTKERLEKLEKWANKLEVYLKHFQINAPHKDDPLLKPSEKKLLEECDECLALLAQIKAHEHFPSNDLVMSYSDKTAVIEGSNPAELKQKMQNEIDRFLLKVNPNDGTPITEADRIANQLNDFSNTVTIRSAADGTTGRHLINPHDKDPNKAKLTTFTLTDKNNEKLRFAVEQDKSEGRRSIVHFHAEDFAKHDRPWISKTWVGKIFGIEPMPSVINIAAARKMVETALIDMGQMDKDSLSLKDGEFKGPIIFSGLGPSKELVEAAILYSRAYLGIKAYSTRYYIPEDEGMEKKFRSRLLQNPVALKSSTTKEGKFRDKLAANSKFIFDDPGTNEESRKLAAKAHPERAAFQSRTEEKLTETHQDARQTLETEVSNIEKSTGVNRPN